MPKFFINSEQAKGDLVTLSKEDSAHIIKSLRKSTGDMLCLSDLYGFDYESSIEHMANNLVTVRITQKQISQVELPFDIHVFQAVPKGSKMDAIIQKNTELGVSSITPFDSEFCVSKLNGKEEKKIARWQKIAEEAAKQSGRSKIPVIQSPLSFDEALAILPSYDIFFTAYESSDQRQLKKVLCSKKPCTSIAFMIGSEGGFSKQEIEKLASFSVPTISLGKRILRTETAAMAVSAMILYELGDVNQ